MSPHATAKIAVNACLSDMRERAGFRELMASIPDWREIEAVIVMRTEQAIVAAIEKENPQNQTEIGF